MSEIYLTDVVIRHPSDHHSHLPDDALLYIFVDDGKEVKRTGYLVKEPNGQSWRLDEIIEVSDSVPLTGLIVMMEYADNDLTQLGFMELVKIIRALNQTDVGPLELVCCCVVIPPATPAVHSFGAFEDAEEEERDIIQQWLLAFSRGEIAGSYDPMRMGCDIKLKKALHLSDDDEQKPWRLMRAGEVAYALYDKLHADADLDSSIVAYEAAVRITPDGHECQAELHNALGISLRSRFERYGDVADIENAIFATECSLLATPDGDLHKAGRMTNLGACFMRLFECSGDPSNIDKAISVQEEAVHLMPDGHSDKPSCLHNLGFSLLNRFRHSGNVVDIDRAISNHERATYLTPEDHSNKACRLDSLGSAFLCRLEHSGNLVDIDATISNHNRAVHLCSDGHANKPIYVNNLGSSFSARFDRCGDQVDLDEAISNHVNVLHLIPDGHANKPGYLSNLGISLQQRYKFSGEIADIDKALSNHEQAVQLTADGHPGKPRHLNNLGKSLALRFECSQELVDIDKAISFQESALLLTPDGHVTKPNLLNNLGAFFLRRFECSEELADINKSISSVEQAVRLTPDAHADKSSFLENLGISFSHRFVHGQDSADRDTAISHFRSAAASSTGSPSKRFRAAVKWARLSGTNDSPSTLEGYKVALDLLPQVVWLGQTITARHKVLSSIGDVANEAAATAISAGRYDTALEWLEQGRSIVWSQLLQLRSPVDALRAVQPSLADDLVRLSEALEHAGSRDVGGRHLSNQPDKLTTLEEVAQGHRRLAEQWEALVKRVRDISGFEDFLKPKKLVQLHNAALAGPVVVINVHKYRCDALVLMAGLDEVIHIPLDCFSYDKAQKLHQSLDQLLWTAGARSRDTRAIKRVTTAPGATFPFILSELWSYVVRPVLDSLALTTSCTTDPPRIWWCPTGPLAFLPIHAAGIYHNSAAKCSVSDFVVSSYTPTLNAIINASGDHKTRQKFRGLLAVSQPNTPGHSALPDTKVELARIRQRVGHFTFDPLEGPVASVNNVVKGMESHSWVHLACHAIQDRVEPTKSAFCLHDGNLELSTIITNTFPHADFAFLSACQTATGDEKLSEEAVHLAAALMLSGYCSVIATMWSINDHDAPMIADNVYSHLFSGKEPDSMNAALALHRAVKCLRQQKGDSAFLSWLPFIHVGI